MDAEILSAEEAERRVKMEGGKWAEGSMVVIGGGGNAFARRLGETPGEYRGALALAPLWSKLTFPFGPRFQSPFLGKTSSPSPFPLVANESSTRSPHLRRVFSPSTRTRPTRAASPSISQGRTRKGSNAHTGCSPFAVGLRRLHSL